MTFYFFNKGKTARWVLFGEVGSLPDKQSGKTSRALAGRTFIPKTQTHPRVILDDPFLDAGQHLGQKKKKSAVSPQVL